MLAVDAFTALFTGLSFLVVPWSVVNAYIVLSALTSIGAIVGFNLLTYSTIRGRMRMEQMLEGERPEQILREIRRWMRETEEMLQDPQVQEVLRAAFDALLKIREVMGWEKS